MKTYNDIVIDNILDKISDIGFNNLSDWDKMLLDKYSKGEDISKLKKPKSKAKPVNRVTKQLKDKLKQLPKGLSAKETPLNKNMSFSIGDEVKPYVPKKKINGNLAMIPSSKGLTKKEHNYIMSREYCKVLDVDDKGFIYTGYKENGKKIYFNPNRFEPYKTKRGFDYNKSDFTLVIGDIRPIEAFFESEIAVMVEVDGIAFSDINGWDYNNLHFTEIYPEIKKLNIDEVKDGLMIYIGDMSKKQLQRKLRSMGFDATLGGNLEMYF